MGSFLDKPKEDKNSTQGKNEIVSWGASEMQGWRTSQEDAYIIHKIELPDGTQGMLFGVFDGHGGKEVSEYVEGMFKDTLLEIPEFKNEKYDIALQKCFLTVDEKIKENQIHVSGCTANVILLTPTQIYCANAGDSRSAMKNSKARPSSTVALSVDHKPNDDIELKRITAAGHNVMLNRVDGSLALSRALGDLEYKDRNDLSAQEQAVTAYPDVLVRDRDENDMFIVLACDGIWDCLSNEECIAKMEQKIQSLESVDKVEDLAKPIEEMFSEIIAKYIGGDNKGTDNMTAILVYFHDNLKSQRFDLSPGLHGSVDTDNGADVQQTLQTEVAPQLDAKITHQ